MLVWVNGAVNASGRAWFLEGTQLREWKYKWAGGYLWERGAFLIWPNNATFEMLRAIKPSIKHKKMKSRITIEVDFNRNNSPVISIMFRRSDDIRDNLLQSFIQKLGGSSNWCRIDVEQYLQDPINPERDFTRWFISPVTDDDIERQSEVMRERIMPSLPKQG